MKQEKISIIVSAYNVEKYIEKCISSLLKQTYTNFEIIVVDDCSQDKTLSLLKKMAREDSRLKILHNRENHGLSYSRNKALKEASGAYYGFVDADDFVPLDFYETLYTALKDQKADMSFCDINVIYEDKGNYQEKVALCEGKPTALHAINHGLAATCCNKLFKKEVFLYPFEDGKINEDVATILPIVIKAQKLAYTKDTYYNYIQHKGSIQNSSFQEKRFDIFDMVSLALDRVREEKDFSKIKECITWNQLMAVLLYAIPKEEKFFRRRHYISVFIEKMKDYPGLDNPYYQEFLRKCNRKNRLFYQLYVTFSFHHFFFLASLLVSFYQSYKKLSFKNVLKDTITFKKLKEEAMQQQELAEDISVIAIIPNYNYARYLKQRVYSILYQTKKIRKIILLDDCSTDNSKEEILKIQKTISPYVPMDVIFNQMNSGSAFQQWAKGMRLALGESDYIWICEADDFCEKQFLEKVEKPLLKEKSVVLSYSNTAFIDPVGNVILKDVTSQIDLKKTGHWKKNYIIDGKEEVKHYSYLNCTISNVSSVLIKNGDYDDIFQKTAKFHQAGDWLFYVSLMKKGKVAYTNKILNYYRVHGNNVSSTFKKEDHLEEIKKVHQIIKQEFSLEEGAEEQMKKRYQELERIWNIE
ncbi:MAG TPA: glycosyltransferase family 2 protein [Candidatus Onthousia faecigallinarum]|nr:glycosyltransferase family 2 protein [Candidatus Onthousia faecigallinarum]